MLKKIPMSKPRNAILHDFSNSDFVIPSSFVIWISSLASSTTITSMSDQPPQNIGLATSKIEKYISVFNIGLQNTFVYRWNYFLRALFGLIPLAGTVFLWGAVFKERGGGLHGYDYGSMIYYYLLTLLVSNLVTPNRG